MYVKNKFLIREFPFLTPNDYEGNRIVTPDYSSTLLDDIPDGWKVGFGYFFCDELKSLLDELHISDDFRILQMKEKFGRLCVYTNTNNERVIELIDKYSDLSVHCCVDCGSQNAKLIKAPHIIPLCERCCHRYYPDGGYAFIDMNKEDFGE